MKAVWIKVWLLAITFLWLIPVLVAGSKTAKIKFLPKHISYQYSCAGLFTGREGAWAQACYLVKLKGRPNWIELSREIVSPMPVAGYRQRLDRLITETRKSKSKDKLYLRLSAHIAGRYKQMYPGETSVEEVKIVNSAWRTDDPEMIMPKGRWRLPSALGADRTHFKTIGCYQRSSDRWEKHVPKQITSPPALRDGDQRLMREIKPLDAPVLGEGTKVPPKRQSGRPL
jgi:hypothetical protein